MFFHTNVSQTVALLRLLGAPADERCPFILSVQTLLDGKYAIRWIVSIEVQLI